MTDWREILSSYPFIRMNRNAGMGKIIERTLRKHQVTVEDAMELDSSESVASMAIAGLGAGVIPAGRLRHIENQKIVTLPFGDPAIYRKVVLVERANNPRSDLSQVLYDQVKRVVTEVHCGHPGYLACDFSLND